MSTRRTQRVARMIREVVSRVLIYELADPRIGFVTVTEVDVAPDMKTARVKLSVMSDASGSELCMKAVRQARGRLQREVAANLVMKITPRLEFELDETVKKSVEISRLINLARSEYRQPDDEAQDPADEPEPQDESES